MVRKMIFFVITNEMKEEEIYESISNMYSQVGECVLALDLPKDANSKLILWLDHAIYISKKVNILLQIM
jgi:hypothetical protein